MAVLPKGLSSFKHTSAFEREISITGLGVQGTQVFDPQVLGGGGGGKARQFLVSLPIESSPRCNQTFGRQAKPRGTLSCWFVRLTGDEKWNGPRPKSHPNHVVSFEENPFRFIPDTRSRTSKCALCFLFRSSSSYSSSSASSSSSSSISSSSLMIRNRVGGLVD